MKIIIKLFMVFIFAGFLPLSAIAEDITVAAAANLQSTLEELKSEFFKETGIGIKVVIGASGKLTAQIMSGAPFDVFMSADMDYPKRLFADGLTIEAPKVYAYGSLVLWTLKDIDLSKGVDSLLNIVVVKVAIASPKSAPYGRQAINVMKSYHLYPQIMSKLVYGESIAQVNQFITTQAVDAGFTAKSVVLAANMKNRGKWIDIDPKMYEPIAQGVVILRSVKDKEADARKFYNFLFSAAAKIIFERYGYNLP